MLDNRQNIDDFETYVDFRRIVKRDVFHLKFRLSSHIISRLLADEINFQIEYDDNRELNNGEFQKYSLIANYQIIKNEFDKQNLLPPDYNLIW